jgi:membrane-bound ClpP family serine protease
MPILDASNIIALGALIVSALTVIFSYLQNRSNNKHALKMLQAQWDNDNKKSHEEAQRRNKEAIDAQRAQEKEFIQSVYTNAIEQLAKLDSMKTTASSKEELIKTRGAAEKAVSLVVIHHYDKESAEFDNFYHLVFIGVDKAASTLVGKIRDFARDDPRLK